MRLVHARADKEEIDEEVSGIQPDIHRFWNMIRSGCNVAADDLQARVRLRSITDCKRNALGQCGIAP